MDIFAAYGHAIVSLALWAVLISVLGGMSTQGRTGENRCDCGKPKRDYSNIVYRRERAYMNVVESAGPFIAVTVAAILAGAAPFWVNLFASIFLVARVGMAVVHIRTVNQPMRSVFFAIGLVSILAQAIVVLLTVF
jgi:uncharacterized MAPEG superfamily protein